MSAPTADEKNLDIQPQAHILTDEKNIGNVDTVDEKNLSNEGLLEAHDLINAENQYTEKQYTKLKRKIDFFLLPVMMLTYGLQYSDKASLSSGSVFGLSKDTHLVGQEYANLTVWFYLAFLIGQIPMAWVLQRIGLGRGLGICAICWGIAVLCLGFCNNYAQLSVTRTFLGWFECALTPGFLILIGSWYKRSEATLRSCCFLAMNTFFNIVFGVIIFFIGKATTEAGTSGWRVINYFLGGITIIDGILVFTILGTPTSVWWLTKEQKNMARARIISNGTGGGETHPWKWNQVLECFRDPQYYFIIMYNFLSNVPNGGFGTFQNLVYTGFGFTPLESILYGLPNNAISFCLILTTATLVGKYPKIRFPAAIMYECVNTIVFVYIGASSDDKWRKWSSLLFVGTGGVCTFMIWSMIPLNTAGRTKKSFMGASAFIGYCVGNMCGSQIFLASDAPRYLKGLTGCGVTLGVNIVNISCWWAYYLWQNKKRDRAFAESGATLEERDYNNKIAGETDMTDHQNQHFRYTC